MRISDDAPVDEGASRNGHLLLACLVRGDSSSSGEQVTCAGTRLKKVGRQSTASLNQPFAFIRLTARHSKLRVQVGKAGIHLTILSAPQTVMAPPILPILLPLATTRPHHSEYILSITPHQQHQLVLTHPSPDISLVDAQSLTLLQQLKGGHVPGTTVSAVVTAASTALDIAVPGGTSAAVGGSGTTGDTSSIWSAGKDARAIRWDTRVDSGAQGPGMTIKGQWWVMDKGCDESAKTEIHRWKRRKGYIGFDNEVLLACAD